MIALIQRVSQASVVIDGKTVGQISTGLLALIGVEKHDDENLADRLAHKMLHYRVFADDADKMNLSVMQVHGSLLLVPQFTLAANTQKGLRPSFNGAEPARATCLFDSLCSRIESDYTPPETGVFGADMQVSSCNDGPVTFWLQVN